MVDSEYNMDIYNSEKTCIGAVLFKFAPDHLKARKMCKHTVKKLPFVIRYVLDQNETQQMCDKAILENGGTSVSLPDCYKNQKINNNYLHALEFIPD